MNSETKNCQNCKNQFTIEPDDFSFYEKMKVPPPTFCAECRLQRRLAFFNLVTLYKRPCDLCKKDTISMYPLEANYTVYCPTCWWGDGWDPLSYARDYDFSRSFFEQFDELMHEVPHLALAIEQNVIATSPYTNYTGSLKNCYLVFNTDWTEDASYGVYIMHSNTMLDSSLVMSSDRCYDSMHIFKVSGGVGLRNQVTESMNCHFLRNCANCQNCFGSANLRNKKYHYFNEPLSKEEYSNRLDQIDFGSYAQYQGIKKETEKHWDSFPQKAYYDDMSVGCTGNMIFESKNCKDSFELVTCQDGRYLHFLHDTKDSYDITGWGGAELSYDSLTIGENAQNIKWSVLSAIGGSDMEYSFLTIGGRGFFGCVSVKKGEYTIFNKPYSKEEFYALRGKIIQQMNDMPYTDKRGNVYRYGEFFPIALSPWTYNATVAQRVFPMTESDAVSYGYNWQEKTPTEHAITKRSEDLPDNIKDVDETILKEVIQCTLCKKGFKIVRAELDFLRGRHFPLPRACPFCRIGEKLDMWLDESKMTTCQCVQCGKTTPVSKLLKNKPIVYCKDCYTKEIV